MGIKAGLDFGTTTSILSYLDGSKLREFYYGGYSGGGTPYVPSVVAYLDNEILIGQQATQPLPAGALVYRYFKMLLPEGDSDKWLSSYGPYTTEQQLVPAQVTTDFIAELITGDSPARRKLPATRPSQSAFLQVQEDPIDELVVSVPQVWSHWQARGRQQLQSVVQELGLKLKQLISEPVAAAAYFSYRYTQKQGEPFRGNLLICDMGGGTFDVTLCKLSDNKVEVLCNAGNGERGLGVAGAHFDHKLLSRKLGDAPDAGVMAELLNKLDQQKKVTNPTLLLSCLQRPGEIPITPIYAIASALEFGKPYSFNFADIEEAFNSVRLGIREVLARIKDDADLRNHPIDKIVLVGGFSRFPLVQQAVAEVFEEDVFEKARLIDLNTFRPDEMAFAISYGACLVANELVQISEKYDHTISAMTFNSSGRAEDEELRLITAGSTLASLEVPTYCSWPNGEKRRFKFRKPSAEVNIVIRRDGSSSESQKISKRCSLTQIPGSDIAGNHWYLGIRVDASKIPYLVVKDAQRETEKYYPLSDLVPHAG
jgi:molecular chaperone DnaK